MLRRLCILAGILASTCTSANVVEDSTREYYVVDQASGVSLLSAMNQASPIRREGEVFHGHTEWHIHWDYKWRVSAGGYCELTSIVTHLSTVTTLPKLRSENSSSIAEFDKYLAALSVHEDGHSAIARQAALIVDRGIAAVSPRSSCHDLAKEADRVGLAAIEVAKRSELEYDAATAHGRTQGAWLPRSGASASRD